MKFLVKYGIGFYIIVTLLFKIKFVIPFSITNTMFYVLMAVSVLLIPFYGKVIFSKKSLKVFWIFHAINLLNLVYFLLFDIQSLQSFLYLIAKVSASNLIMLGLIYNAAFYERWVKKYLKFILLFVILLGFVFGVSEVNATRLSMGFNPNDIGSLSVLGLFVIIGFNHSWFKSKIDLGMALIFFILVLVSGSKTALGGIAFIALVTYGFSLKNIGLAALLGIAMFITSNLGFNTGVDRLLSKERAFETRDDVFKKGMLTFQDELFFGNGLDKYGWSNPKYLRPGDVLLGPHNTYIAIGIMYGLIFGVLFLFLLFQFLWQSAIKIKRLHSKYLNLCFYFTILIMINGVSETLVVGINEYTTIMFWFCIGVVAFGSSQKSKVNYVPNY